MELCRQPNNNIMLRSSDVTNRPRYMTRPNWRVFGRASLPYGHLPLQSYGSAQCTPPSVPASRPPRPSWRAWLIAEISPSLFLNLGLQQEIGPSSGRFILGKFCLTMTRGIRIPGSSAPDAENQFASHMCVYHIMAMIQSGAGQRGAPNIITNRSNELLGAAVGGWIGGNVDHGGTRYPAKSMVIMPIGACRRHQSDPCPYRSRAAHGGPK